jgi:hypothetical protein
VLTEFANVTQRRGEPRRRWFRSPDEDLIVWYDGDGSLWGFQLCYDRNNRERALTWTKDKGYSHLKVDDGEVEPLTAKRTPILVPDGVFDSKSALERFLAISKSVPEDVVRLVVEKLEGYGEKDT